MDTYGVVNRKQNQMEKPHTQLSSCAGIPKVLYDAGYNLLSGLGFLAALQAVAWRYMWLSCLEDFQRYSWYVAILAIL